jgi:hypothetical protein
MSRNNREVGEKQPNKEVYLGGVTDKDNSIITNLRLVYSFSRVSDHISTLPLRSDTFLKQVEHMSQNSEGSDINLSTDIEISEKYHNLSHTRGSWMSQISCH